MSIKPRHLAVPTSVEASRALLINLQTRHTAWQQAQQLMAAQLAPQFSPFSVYRSNEVDVSRHLQLLLDPQGTHGQGSLFWGAFVEQVLDTYKQQNVQGAGVSKGAAHGFLDWLSYTQVRSTETELPTSEGRFIDLFVRTQHGVLGIENKPWLWSKDGVLQLRDYANYLSESAGNAPWALVYLAHNLPSEDSWPLQERIAAQQKGQFVHVPWLCLIVALKTCMPKIQALKVRWFVEDLIVMMEKSMGYTDNAQMEHLAQAFTNSPQSLSQAFLLRDTLKQWQATQLTKLEGMLKKRCDALGIHVNWQVKPAKLDKSYGYISLKFEQHPHVFFHIEWDYQLKDEAAVYWGLNVKKFPINKARSMCAVLSKLCPSWPDEVHTEADWPCLVFLGDDPLFTPHPDSLGANIAHPWLSMDYEGEGNFVELVLQRYQQARAALDHESMQKLGMAKL